ncbi:cation:proton antiporter [Candidatus Woesebacteria bacterium]|nr:cation:proton antiporter [Candidatus Woesebacteria bacterium]
MEIFIELTLVLGIAFTISIALRFFKQPLIVGYILTGVLVGPYGLNILKSIDTIELFSTFGITILLFIIGINLSPKVIKEVGKVSIFTGIAQVVLTSAIGFGLALLLGLDQIAALYVGIALTFSSTIIILKLLSDKGDLKKLYGKIAIGFLIVQDVIATIILLVASSFGPNVEGSFFIIITTIVLKALFLIGGIVLLTSFLLPRIESFVASSQELLFLFSIVWGFSFAALFHFIGFSVEIGALVGGVTLSTTPYAYEVSSRLRPLRDFFVLTFFILLGSHMMFTDFSRILFPAFVFSIFVIIGNPVIMIILMNLMRYSKRTSFYTGLTVAQISEFSLILATLGFQLGHLDQTVLSIITMVGIITISVSAYLILHADKLYPRLEKLLEALYLMKTPVKRPEEQSYQAILFGYQRVGQDFLQILKKIGLEYIVVDYNPSSIHILEDEHEPYIYGDAADSEFVSELDLKNVQFVISTIPSFEVNTMLVREIRTKNRKAIILVISHNAQEARTLYEVGATYVIMPHYLGAQHAVKIIEKHGLVKNNYLDLKNKHLAYLHERSI